ncbi:Mn2+/Zn2+ ABC transporter substrate-binding protein [Paenibacillus sp. FSL R7-0273]|uniref:metal ABC transporter solute-binding protein, Zn/Mn family n=1 Tax=Paenibacillus sp. FSL R7-0273 TaxID=1536772 RepID=UPI0004F8F792|nr:zinc ABC transporter substrate-binding protein [Paenibacillus sp. FSL R7-0273]AIQ46528.1 Mn2+/Zn2+ ABC transporter substrate-binding protein [Paenibacillus sp. FSL R7-0273]OMF97705.1 Mn2+/Zn2+ ABC transporter substrate-binding protein [Paenibacillus sp. FSL R7-0273]
MKFKMLQTLAVLLTVTLVLFGCQSQKLEEGSTGNNETTISVVASFLPMYEFTKKVAGDRADVQLMVSEGQDAHHYEPSAQDVAVVNKADVFVYSSDEMEFWTKSLFKTIENDNLIIVRAADGPGRPETEKVQVEGAANHYHTGDEIELTAKLTGDADYDHWHWYQRADANEEWAAISGQGTDTFILEAPGKSFEVKAVIYDHNHSVYAESEPVELHIDNHDNHVHIDEKHEENDHEDHSHTQAGEGVSIVGLADHYHTGDVVTLNANIIEEKNYEHWNWFVREDSEQDWEAVPDQETERFEYKTSGDSFEVKAVLYDNDHNVYAESSAISVKIDNHEGKDPHIWLDPVLAQDQVLAIRNALIEADPNGKQIYEENAEAFVKELKALDNDYQAALKDAEHRTFVVQHQAFGYLADRYNLEQIAIGGLSTEVEPSPSRIAEISELVHKHNVPVIYYQQGASSSIAQTVATETGTETAVLYDLEVLSEELLANDLGYLEAMRHNLEALQASIH